MEWESRISDASTHGLSSEHVALHGYGAHGVGGEPPFQSVHLSADQDQERQILQQRRAAQQRQHEQQNQLLREQQQSLPFQTPRNTASSTLSGPDVSLPSASDWAYQQHDQSPFHSFGPDSKRIPIPSPQTDVFSGACEDVFPHGSASTPSRTSRSSLQSLQELSALSLASSPNEAAAVANDNALRPPETIPLTSRSSSEIAAIRRRRQIRRTYTGPTGGSSSSLATFSSAMHSPNVPAEASAHVHRHPSLGHMRHTPPSLRPRSGTVASLTVAERPLDEAAQSAMSSSSSARLPTSLSAELAGLGLNVNGLYGDADISMSESEGANTSMNRSMSNSTSSTTRRNDGPSDTSIFSQDTTQYSSGLDDSVSSSAVGPMTSSKWVHGRDTPSPSTPPHSTPSITTSPSVSSAMSFAGGGRHPVGGDSFSARDPRPHHFEEHAGSTAMRPPNMHYTLSDQSLSVPHTPSHARSVSQRMSSATQAQQERRARRSSHIVSGDFGPLTSRDSIRSASNLSRNVSRNSLHSLGDSITGLSGNDDPDRGSAVHGSAKMDRRKRWSSALTTAAGSGSSSSLGVMSNDSGRLGARSRGTRTGREQHVGGHEQYDQVTSALETLRTFLKQRERHGSTLSGIAPPAPAATAAGSGGSSATHAEPTQMADNSEASPTAVESAGVSRVLRHPPSGPLPPRGSVLQTPNRSGESLPGRTTLRSHSSASFYSTTTPFMSPAHDDNQQPWSDRPLDSPVHLCQPAAGVMPAMSLSASTSAEGLAGDSHARSSVQQPQHRQHTRSQSSALASNSSAERVAIFEDLAVRLRQMRHGQRDWSE